MKEEPFYYGWKIVFSGFVAMALSYGTLMNCIGQFIFPITEELGYSKASLSLCFGLIHAGMVISSPTIAGFIVKYGPKACMSICAFIISLCAFLFSVSSQLWQLYCCTAVMGLAFIGISTLPVSILVNSWFASRNKGLAVSLAFMGSGIGGMVFNPVISQLIIQFGWRIAFSFLGGLLIVLYIPITLAIVKNPPEEKSSDNEETILPETDIECACGREDADYKAALKSKILWIMCLGIIFISGAGNSVMMHCVPYFISLDFPPTAASTIIGADLGFLAGGKILLGWYSDRYGIKKCAIHSISIMSFGLICLYLVHIFHSMYLAFIVFFGVGSACVTVCVPLLVDKLFGRKNYAKILGFASMFVGIGNVTGPILVGFIFDYFNTYTVAWIITALLTFTAVMLFHYCFRASESEESKLT